MNLLWLNIVNATGMWAERFTVFSRSRGGGLVFLSEILLAGGGAVFLQYLQKDTQVILAYGTVPISGSNEIPQH